MTLHWHALRASAIIVMWLSYAMRTALRTGDRISSALWPRRDWRSIEIGPLQIQVPPDWGDLEPDHPGGFVIHNRKRRFRTDGDAVWYSSAIELRVRTPEAAPPSRYAAMTETCRTLAARSEDIVLAIAIANGVGPSRRRQAERVLRSVRIIEGGPPIKWPES